MRNKKVFSVFMILFFLPLIVSAECGATENSIEFCNPLAFETVEGVLGSFLNALQGVIVAISMIFIIVGGVFYITSSGDEERMKMAKKAITASMVGLAIGVAAPSFLKEIYDILGGKPEVNCAGLSGEDLIKCNEVNKTLTAGLPIAVIAMNVLNFLLGVVGALAVIMLVYGGIKYLTAAGNEDSAEAGKKLVKYAIVGIAVCLAALVIVKQIAVFFK